MTTFDPLAGTRIKPAWAAAASILRDGGWHSWTSIVTAMVKASDLKPVSCSNLLHDAITSGWVQRAGQHPKRRIRVTSSGRALRAELVQDGTR